MCAPDGVDQACGVRAACTGNVESRAMVGGCPYEGQAERDVYPAVEIQGLERDQRLIVIHAKCRVIAGARFGMKQGIGRQGAGARQCLRPATP